MKSQQEIDRIKAQIKNGEYLTDEKIDQTADKVAQVILNSQQKHPQLWIKGLTIAFILVLVVAVYHKIKTVSAQMPKSNYISVKSKQPTYEQFFDAIVAVESRGKLNAYHTKTKAAGFLQIRPIMVDECNRIAQMKKLDKRWTLSDRWNRNESVAMWNLFQDYWLNHWGFDRSNYEVMAKMWIGGPDGWKADYKYRKDAEDYWRLVSTELQKSLDI